MKHVCLLLTAGLCAPSARSQGLADLYVTDSTNDAVLRVRDVGADGSYNEAGDVTTFYDENLGTIALGNNADIAIDAAGVLYVCDSTTDLVLALSDLDGDGECNDAGEHWIWFESLTNAEGIEMQSAGGLSVDSKGTVWVAVGGSGTPQRDSILRLRDENGDGDAMDLGESREYFVPAPGGVTADSIPQDVQVGRDGLVYYLEVGASGALPKGIYQLDDSDESGTIDATEVLRYYDPSIQPGTPFFWDLFQDPAGGWLVADTGNELVIRVQDTNGNGIIDAATEETILWSSAVPSLIWGLEVAPDGSIYAGESQTPDRILRMFDANADGMIDPLTEVTAVWDETLAAGVDIGNPRGLVIDRSRGAVGANFCQSSTNSSGGAAVIRAGGSRSVAFDDLTLVAEPLPANQNGLFFYGAAQAQTAFGNGTRCVGAGGVGLFRLPVVSSAADGVLCYTIEQASTPPNGDLVVGSTWYFQAWFRDPAAAGAAFDLSDGIGITFLP